MFIAFAGVLISRLTGSTVVDAVASVIIGLLLCAVALFLARESRGLLIGESVDPHVEHRMREIAEACPDVEQVLYILTVQTGPHDVFLAMDVRFRPALTAARMVEVIDAIESGVRKQYPDAKRIFIEADRIVAATK